MSMSAVKMEDLGFNEPKQKGVIKEILDNHRDVAMYKRAMNDILLCLEGYNPPVQGYKDNTEDYVVRSVAELKKKVMNERFEKMIEICGLQVLINRYATMSIGLDRIIKQMKATGRERETWDASLIDDAKIEIDAIHDYLNQRKD